MKRIGLLLLVLLAASQASSQVPDDKVVVPGVRIGKWTLQMTIDDLLQMNGSTSPVRVTASVPPVVGWRQDFWAYKWNFLRFAADTYDKKTLSLLRVGIEMGSGAYVTDKGIAMGQNNKRSDALKVYGEPTAVVKSGGGQSDVIYGKIGIVFRGFDPDQEIRSIFILRPGSTSRIWKI